METELKKLPQHLAFVVDGNGRWAKERGLPRTAGHSAGVKNLDKILKETFYNYKIETVSIFLFSTENWNRPKTEVDWLMKLFRDYFKKDFMKKFPNVKLNVMGDYTKFPDDVAKNIAETIERTKDCSPYVLNVALNYSGQDDLVHAFNEMMKEGIKTADRETIDKHLYTHGQIPLDFVIRTGGEHRISNFMLWQMAYAELYFPKTYFPAFSKKDLHEALLEYQKRDRRYGTIKE